MGRAIITLICFAVGEWRWANRVSEASVPREAITYDYFFKYCLNYFLSDNLHPLRDRRPAHLVAAAGESCMAGKPGSLLDPEITVTFRVLSLVPLIANKKSYLAFELRFRYHRVGFGNKTLVDITDEFL